MPWLMAKAWRFAWVITMPMLLSPSVSPVNTAFSFWAATSVRMFLNDAMSAASCVRFILISALRSMLSPMPVAMSP